MAEIDIAQIYGDLLAIAAPIGFFDPITILPAIHMDGIWRRSAKNSSPP